MAVIREAVKALDNSVTATDGVDKTAEALAAAMFAPGSSRERHRLLSTQAAQLERNGQYDAAMRTWIQAANQALYDVERHWCESRAQWCEQCLQRQG